MPNKDKFVNVSGTWAHEVARDVAAIANKHLVDGQSPEILALLIAATAVDVWRFNCGDDHLLTSFQNMIQRRLEEPAEHWGGKGEITDIERKS